ncbi:MAG: YiiD C-terminal domain-containing protein [Pyrinomonadaceae bacterium]|nr:YiiD C-terminal domain-containing protein [Sphingobacteriaceae bacterium]
MLVSERALKWIMRFYPPLLFQRIWTLKFDKDFMGAHVKICKSILNSNYNKSIFGGTIFSAADPFYPILFHQRLKRKGFKVRLWLKHSTIDYIKPGVSDLYFSIHLTDEEFNEAIEILGRDGKFIKTFSVKITNKEGEICAMVYNEIYIKN